MAYKWVTAASLLSMLLSPVSCALVPRQSGNLRAVEVKGNAFFAGNDRFYVRGLAYQPGGAADAADPLLDIPSLKRDIVQFKKLGINTIRVYTVDNSKSHDEAMGLLDDAGIYLALDVNTPKYSLNRESASSLHMSYNDVYLQSVFATVDNFAKYDNLLLFFSGNEVINQRNNTNSAPYIKAVTRDMRQYISKKHKRRIPVGYSAADVAENIEQQALYFNCGPDEERADFFSFNDYSWCDPSSFTISGWDQKVKTYSDYSVPLFLSEFGCITNRRDWNEIASLYSTQMSAVYSGGLAYEYSVESNNFGLVTIKPDGTLEFKGDFERLAAAFKKTPNPSGNGGFKANGSPSKCPPADEEWEVTSTALPLIPEPAKKYMDSSVGNGPGLAGEGSQWHGTPSKSKVGVGSTSEGGNGEGNGGGNGGKKNAASSMRGEASWKSIAAVVASIALGAQLLL